MTVLTVVLMTTWIVADDVRAYRRMTAAAVQRRRCMGGGRYLCMILGGMARLKTRIFCRMTGGTGTGYPDCMTGGRTFQAAVRSAVNVTVRTGVVVDDANYV